MWFEYFIHVLNASRHVCVCVCSVHDANYLDFIV